MLAAVALGLLLSLRGRNRANLTEWSIGGRSLGIVLIFVLMAGETYTSFSYLGAAGWSYNYGMPVFYLLAYLAIGFAVGYVIGPILWHYAHRNKLHNITDITAYRFDSPWFGAAVAILTTVFLLPYIQLQITGMGVVVSTISYGTISLGTAYVIAFFVTEAFIIFSGLRGSAWVSIRKDSLAIITLLVVFIYVPVHYFGGLGPMLDRLVAERPEWLVLPGQGKESLGMLWFATTGLLNGVVYTIFPTTVAGYLGAKNPGVLRRNAIIMPFYQVLLFVPILLGLAAVFVVPGLEDSNLAMFKLVVDSMPAWLVGLVGVAGALSSIVPMALFMLVIGTMWGRSVLGVHPRTAPHQKQVVPTGRLPRRTGGVGLHLHLAEHPGAVVSPLLPRPGTTPAGSADQFALETHVDRGRCLRARSWSGRCRHARHHRQRPLAWNQCRLARACGQHLGQHRGDYRAPR